MLKADKVTEHFLLFFLFTCYRGIDWLTQTVTAPARPMRCVLSTSMPPPPFLHDFSHSWLTAQLEQAQEWGDGRREGWCEVDVTQADGEICIEIKGAKAADGKLQAKGLRSKKWQLQHNVDQIKGRGRMRLKIKMAYMKYFDPLEVLLYEHTVSTKTLAWVSHPQPHPTMWPARSRFFSRCTWCLLYWFVTLWPGVSSLFLFAGHRDAAR